MGHSNSKELPHSLCANEEIRTSISISAASTPSVKIYNTRRRSTGRCARPSVHRPSIYITDPEVDPLFCMSKRDCQIIQRSWIAIPCHETLGQQIFVRIFQIKPDLKKSFHLQFTPNDQLYDKPVFCNHAHSFITFLNLVVQSIDVNDINTSCLRMMQHCREIGIRHAKISRYDQNLFNPDYWFVFASCAASVIVAYTPLRYRLIGFGSRTMFAWRMLLIRLILEMKVSFYRELFDAKGTD